MGSSPAAPGRRARVADGAETAISADLISLYQCPARVVRLSLRFHAGQPGTPTMCNHNVRCRANWHIDVWAGYFIT